MSTVSRNGLNFSGLAQTFKSYQINPQGLAYGMQGHSPLHFKNRQNSKDNRLISNCPPNNKLLSHLFKKRTLLPSPILYKTNHKTPKCWPSQHFGEYCSMPVLPKHFYIAEM
jgi:hypothetical protein